jgi:UDP-N-acetylmuramoyl-tripeptide--D-alanyl-D-alanine ligase
MIKQFIKKTIIFLLQTEAKLILFRYKPKIIAITGTVGKTSAKEAVYKVVSSKFSAAKSEKSYNSEFGVPLSIIGAKSGWNNIFAWIFNLLKGIKVLLLKKDYPKWLILEIGVNKPDDMKKLVSWIKPNISVITALGEIPVHVEYFKDAEDLIKEKGKLVQVLTEENYAVLNGDDQAIVGLKEKIRAQTMSYGFSEGLDLMASNYHITFQENNEPDGITFKVDYKGNIVPFRLHNVFGKQAVYASLAALAVGSVLDLNLVEMAESLSFCEFPPGRLKLLKGIKHSLIIDDSYNSSPLAVKIAIEALQEIPAKRKIAVLGDMLELGKYTIEEHKKLGRLLKDIADFIFLIGPRSKFAGEEARAIGVDPKNIFEFSSSEEAKKKVQEIIKEGDLILVKGSQAMRMEKITEEIMADPELKEKLLVRQEKEWSNK